MGQRQLKRCPTCGCWAPPAVYARIRGKGAAAGSSPCRGVRCSLQLVFSGGGLVCPSGPGRVGQGRGAVVLTGSKVDDGQVGWTRPEDAGA